MKRKEFIEEVKKLQRVGTIASGYDLAENFEICFIKDKNQWGICPKSENRKALKIFFNTHQEAENAFKEACMNLGR